MKRKRLVWESKHCPVCGILLTYLKNGHEPTTCINWECIYTYQHGKAIERVGTIIH